MKRGYPRTCASASVLKQPRAITLSGDVRCRRMGRCPLNEARSSPLTPRCQSRPPILSVRFSDPEDLDDYAAGSDSLDSAGRDAEEHNSLHVTAICGEEAPTTTGVSTTPLRDTFRAYVSRGGVFFISGRAGLLAAGHPRQPRQSPRLLPAHSRSRPFPEVPGHLSVWSPAA